MSSTERQNAGHTLRPLARTQPMFHRVLQAEPHDVRRTLKDLRTRFASQVSADAMGRLELVLAEVMNNVVEHADLAPQPLPGSMSRSMRARLPTCRRRPLRCRCHRPLRPGQAAR